jgi:LAGLIDADG DNA endonuclease family
VNKVVKISNLLVKTSYAWRNLSQNIIKTHQKMTKQPILQKSFSFLTAAERKNLVEVMYKQSKTLHPWWEKGRELPKPINPEGLKDVDVSKKQMAQIEIPDIQRSVLCGTIFGDTSIGINKGYKNARVQNRHSTRQASWFFWKWLICLKDLNNGLSSITFQNPDGKQLKSVPASGEILGKLKISSKATPVLTQIYNVICEKKKKKIERKWLNHMNNYFLMTLWLDDGSLMNNRQGVFSLDLLKKEDQEILAQYLKTVWKINCYVKQQPEIMVTIGTYGYRIVIADQESLLNLLRVIAPVVPVKEMLYKVMFVPENNRDLLQRWASELETLVYPEFKEYVKNEYQNILLDYGN